MAPSLSPSFTAALDVRQPAHADSHEPFNFNVFAETSPSTADTPSQSKGVSGAVIGLSLLLSLVIIGATVAVWYIFVQRKKLAELSTIRVLYNVGDAEQSESNNSKGAARVEQEKVTSADVATGEKMYSINLAENKPKLLPFVPSGESPHIFPLPGLRRKYTRVGALQRLRIVIPPGVAMPDVEVVRTATPGTTPTTAVASAVSATRTSVSRRHTARTPRSALSSAMTAVSHISTAAINMVHKREKVETVYQSNGWAPATIVHLPSNPRDAKRSASMTTANNGRRLARKPVRPVPVSAGITDAVSEEKPMPIVQ